MRTYREVVGRARDGEDDKGPTEDVERAAESWPYPEVDIDKPVGRLPFRF